MSTFSGQHQFFGPVHWHACEMPVPRIPGEWIVCCIGRDRVLTTARPISLDAESVAAELVVATCLSVQWAPARKLDAPPVLLVSGDGWQLARPFERTLLERPGCRMPGLTAKLIAPSGNLHLEVTCGERVLWQHDCVAKRKHTRIEIDAGL